MPDITTYIQPIIFMACLVVGYCLKNIIRSEVVNDWIPTIMAVLGAVLSCCTGDPITLTSVTSGALTGLASTGAHQALTRAIKAIDGTENGQL